MSIMMYAMETMGDRIRRLRNARGYTLDALRDKLVEMGASPSLTRAAVQKWESGETRNPRNEEFVLLYKALGTDGEYLLWGDTRTPPRAPAPTKKSSKSGEA